MTTAELPWQDYGLAGLVVGVVLVSVVALTWWFIRAARTDMHSALAESKESRDQFTGYLQDTARQQTEVLVAVGNALHANTQAMLRSDDRAEDRHKDIVQRLDLIQEKVK